MSKFLVSKFAGILFHSHCLNDEREQDHGAKVNQETHWLGCKRSTMNILYCFLMHCATTMLPKSVLVQLVRSSRFSIFRKKTSL